MLEQDETKNAMSVQGGFWRRQFAGAVTASQLAYDLIFGIVLPILCFIFDPIAFSGREFVTHIAPITQYKLHVYLFSALSIITLAVWLLAYRTLKSAGGIVAGILLSGAVFSLLIGLLILPLTLIGLMLIIGVLGLTPFFTAFVYLRNGIRAMRLAESYVGYPKLVSSLLSGAILILALPYAAYMGLNHTVALSINDLTTGDPQAAEDAIRRLKYVGWSGEMDQLVWAYLKEQDQTRKQNLARAYKVVTGEDVEHRLAILRD